MLSTNGRGRSDSVASASSHPEASTIVMDLDSFENDSSGFSRTMCFSHCFFNNNVGLVCSERGLLHFDLRLPARSQRRASLVSELKRTCKACFPWQTGGESAYVFAGGTTSTVGLYDLRMAGDTSSQVVQTYRPRALRSKQAAVSGIDLSKDKREILVSYEADHIYRFPCFPEAPAAGPSLEDINECSNSDKPLSELAGRCWNFTCNTFSRLTMHCVTTTSVRGASQSPHFSEIGQVCRSKRRVYLHRFGLRAFLDLRKTYWRGCELHKKRQLYMQWYFAAS